MNQLRIMITNFWDSIMMLRFGNKKVTKKEIYDAKMSMKIWDVREESRVNFRTQCVIMTQIA